jgi:hypothetical protein
MKFSFASKRMLNFEYQRNMLLGLTTMLLLSKSAAFFGGITIGRNEPYVSLFL